jgi:8-oxo-dGTP pyrophosphatase MutT (NUDIX family)
MDEELLEIVNERGEVLRIAPRSEIHGNPSLEEAAKRELQEELGFTAEPQFLYSYTHSNDYETEMVYTYYCVHEGPFAFNPAEIDFVRFWPLEEIRTTMEGPVLSDNFKHEITTYLAQP